MLLDAIIVSNVASVLVGGALGSCITIFVRRRREWRTKDSDPILLDPYPQWQHRQVDRDMLDSIRRLEQTHG